MENRIRRGGVRTADGFLFELTGGDISLDFLNTLDSRPAEARELLPAFADLVSWSKQAGIVDAKQERFLRKKAKQYPEKAEKARRFAISLREHMFGIFYAVAEGQAIPEESLNEWNGIVRKSMAHFEMTPTPEGLRWRWRAESGELDSMLWPVVHAAAQLLTGPQAKRIRRCASSRCDWMFLDTSKRGNRCWCDMTVCGNRAKAARFYSRKKTQPQA